MNIAAPGTVDVSSLVRRVEASGLGDDAWTRLLTEHMIGAAHRLAPRDGVMLQAVWFDAGSRPGRLLLVIHAFVADADSWRILLDDLETGTAALGTGRAIATTPPDPNYPRWARQLGTSATDPTRLAELPHWLTTVAGVEPPIGDRALDPAVDAASSGGRWTTRLDQETAAAVLATAPQAFHARADEVLLSGLLLAIGEWRRRTGAVEDTGSVLIDIERSARPARMPGPDLSRTVGCFTVTFPVRLATGHLDWPDVARGDDAVGAFLMAAKDRLRSVPDNGIGFGVLRYLNASTARSLEGGATPQVVFAFHDFGREPEPAEWALQAATPDLPDVPTTPFSHPLIIDAIVHHRPGGREIRLSIRWPRGLLPDTAATELAELWCGSLRGIAAAAAATRTARHSPTDMTMGGLSQQEIDELEVELEGLV